MDICFFGTYAKGEGYPVNAVLLKGLEQAGAKVVECHEPLWGTFLHRAFSNTGLLGLLRLGGRVGRAYTRLVRRYRRLAAHPVVVVGYPGYVDVWLARLLNWRRRRLVVLVAFISLYDTTVGDRGTVRAGSFKAGLLRRIDRWAFLKADVVLVDTAAHAAHYAELLQVPAAKFMRSYVGQDEAHFRPAAGRAPKEKLDVLFFGTYVPLHGIDTILAAADLLRDEGDIVLTLVGNGQLYADMRRRAEEKALDNVRFVDQWMDADALEARIGAADICLGIFGTTAKAARVIPYKVFGALAMRKPLVTRDSPAVRELLCDGRDALLCSPGSAPELADALRRLRDDPALAARLAAAGHRRYLECGTPRAIGAELLGRLEARLVG